MTEGIPAWRVDKDRERIEHECEERAREGAAETLTDPELASAFVVSLDEDDQGRLGTELACMFDTTNAAVTVGHGLYAFLFHRAYRRALAAERRKEGLE